MSIAVRLFKDTYLDSVLQLSGTRAMSHAEGVTWAAAAMATAANLETLRDRGIDDPGLQGARANDLFLAVLAGSDDEAEAAIEEGRAALFSGSVPGSSARGGDPGDGRRAARSLTDAVSRLDGANLAIVSVPGAYAAIETHKALSAGLHVLLFSDNVTLEEEIELKDRAAELGLLVMGPGAGTAMLGGTGLGFANVVTPGRVGVVAAAGTGAQEAMSLLDQWGAGVSHVIGLGGRDLSQAVGGRMARAAIAALRDDPDTDAILLVSKPPDPEVARAVTAVAGDKPLVAALIGLRDHVDEATARVTATLEEGVSAAMALVGFTPPDPAAGLLAPVAAACDRLGEGRSLIRGLFSGGTLCYEALSLLGPLVGPVYSNTPIDKRWALPAPPDAHVCLDLGEEEYTRGRPHPMIDPEARIEMMRAAGRDPSVAVVLIDVVLGYGSHPDPAGLLAPVASEIMAGGAGRHTAGGAGRQVSAGGAGRQVTAGDSGPQVVAYVLGTDGDPQGLGSQRQVLREAGCIVAATAARATMAAAALARRQPDLVLRLP